MGRLLIVLLHQLINKLYMMQIHAYAVMFGYFVASP